MNPVIDLGKYFSVDTCMCSTIALYICRCLSVDLHVFVCSIGKAYIFMEHTSERLHRILMGQGEIRIYVQNGILILHNIHL
jgi:hypothetical protein